MNKLRNNRGETLIESLVSILIAVLARGGDIIIPEGSSSIREGDSVILISRDLRILDLNDIYEDEGAFPVPGGSNEH